MNKLDKLLKLYAEGKKISCVTAYDASISKYLDSCDIDIILVGDSLGQVIQGSKSTHDVSIKDILYHAKCVKSGQKNSILMVDLPKGSYVEKSGAYSNASKFLSTKLADIIKVEIDNNNLENTLNVFSKHDVELYTIGKTGGDSIIINNFLDVKIEKAKDAWENGLNSKL